jgi:Chalcone isomerase-like
MRKLSLSLAVLLLVSASTFSLNAASLAGVTLPDTAQVGGKTLVLNGMGIRTKAIFKIYVGGLYLEQKSSDANAIIKADAPKQIVMKFVHVASKSQMTDAFNEGFSDNAPEATKTMKAQINQLVGGLDAVKIGDTMVFTYIPGTGSSMAINGQNKVTIADPAFGPVLFSVWLGPKPPNADLKKGMLGK